MAMRHPDPQAFAAWCPSVAPGHVGRRPCLVNEHQPLRIQIELTLEPGLPPLQDVGPVLLARMRRLFLRVIL